MSSPELSIARGGAEPGLREISMARLLQEAAARYPHHDAVVSVWQEKTLTFQQLDAAASNAAAALIAFGIVPGDRVGIWSGNRLEWVIVQFAVAKIGAILVNINPAYRQTELGYVIEHAKCKALFLAPSFRGYSGIDAARSVRAASSSLEFVFLLDDSDHEQAIRWSDFLEYGKNLKRTTLDEITGMIGARQPVSIQYTSGTTGAPKGATLSHFNLVNNGVLIGARLRLRETDRICLPVPLFHCFGMVIGVLGAFAHGAAVVFASESFDAGACLSAVEQEGCTAIYGVPMMFIAMLNHADFEPSRLTSLRTGLMGGAPCPAEIVRAAIDKMHMREIAVLYGMTETSPISLQGTPEDSFDQRVHSVGAALPHTEVKIVDSRTGEAAPIGIPGELCVRGYHVMLGYWDNPEATRNAIDADGWMHSGDLAVMRDDRYVAIVGRIKDMIIRGGENIFPREIEEFLHTVPEVAEAQVFGIPDPLYGEQVCAWVRTKPGKVLDEDSLRSRCKGKIANFKIPHHIRFVDEFPATASGKVQKFRMREIETRERGMSTAPIS